MIYIEPNEKQSKLFDDIPHKVCEHLEEWTGADIMVTVSKLPVTTQALVNLHIKNGAILVQRKSGMDLISSMGERMNSSLERMRSAGAQQVQCVLLFVGSMTENADGKVVVDGFTSDYTLANVVGSLEGWVERGGVYSCIEKGKLGRWLAIKEHHLEVYQERKVKYIFPESPMQELKGVNDWRITIATFPMMGVAKTNALYDAIVKSKCDNTLLTALYWLTIDDDLYKVGGIGSETVQAVRKWLGLPEGFGLTLIYDGDET